MASDTQTPACNSNIVLSAPTSPILYSRPLCPIMESNVVLDRNLVKHRGCEIYRYIGKCRQANPILYSRARPVHIVLYPCLEILQRSSCLPAASQEPRKGSLAALKGSSLPADLCLPCLTPNRSMLALPHSQSIYAKVGYI